MTKRNINDQKYYLELGMTNHIDIFILTKINQITDLYNPFWWANYLIETVANI